jgi:hypothetical protein
MEILFKEIGWEWFDKIGEDFTEFREGGNSKKWFDRQ